jgi:hypothetical protein
VTAQPRSRCVSCGSFRQVELIGDHPDDGYGCPAHLRGLRGRLGNVLDNLTWLQETRQQRLLDRHL